MAKSLPLSSLLNLLLLVSTTIPSNDFFPNQSSSNPTQYVSHMEQNDCVGSSGDVVIVVPSMDNLPEPEIRPPTFSDYVCINAEADMEPKSPRTITESSSEFMSNSKNVFDSNFFFGAATLSKLSVFLLKTSSIFIGSYPQHTKSNVPLKQFIFFGILTLCFPFARLSKYSVAFIELWNKANTVNERMVDDASFRFLLLCKKDYPNTFDATWHDGENNVLVKLLLLWCSKLNFIELICETIWFWKVSGKFEINFSYYFVKFSLGTT